MGRGIKLSNEELEGKVVAGVDTHADTHWLCVLDTNRRVAVSREFTADAKGYAELAEAIGDPERCAAVGVEGTTSYGAALTDELVRRGFRVLEVLNRKKDRKRRKGEGKSDEIDAERAARDVLAGDGTSVPKLRGGWVDDLRSLLVARDRCVDAKVKAHGAALSLIRTAPEEERRRWKGLGQERLMKSLLKLEEEGASALHFSLLMLARVWEISSRQADALEEEMWAILKSDCPSMLATFCCGAISAAELAISAGENPERLESEASFAMMCGAAPIPASSGNTSGRVRLNPGGNRRANKALHTIALSRTRVDPRTQAYMAKRCGGEKGLSWKEAMRCLKRYIAREVYHALMHPFDTGERIDRDSLKAARTAAGLTQAQVAAALGVSRSSVSGVESGRNPCRYVAEKYSRWVLDGMPMDTKEGQESA